VKFIRSFSICTSVKTVKSKSVFDLLLRVRPTGPRSVPTHDHGVEGGSVIDLCANGGGVAPPWQLAS
jgi:hypothetical protein